MPAWTSAVVGPGVRQFATGATRDTDDDKFDFEGFLSPLVLERFAAYMHKHRLQRDGSLRDSDNWQKGIPTDQYAKSLLRHMMQFWKLHRGLATTDERGEPVELDEALCALLFNVQGYLYELLVRRPRPAPVATGEDAL